MSSMEKRHHPDDEPDNTYPKRTRPGAEDGGGTDSTTPLTYADYTIAWICALSVELGASYAMLDEKHPSLPVHESDYNTYVLGRIAQHNVVMVCLPGEYGTNNAAIVATDLKHSFPSIRATLMVGIGGGAPGVADIRLGDVVVGMRVMQHDMGKDVGNGQFERKADVKTPSRRLLGTVSTLRAIHGQDEFSRRVADLLQTKLRSYNRPDKPDQLFQPSYYHHPLKADTCDGCDADKVQPRRLRISNQPYIHYGGVASGNSVIKDAKKRDDIARQFSVLCFEMEAAGMTDSQCLPIRGICDYADSHKNKDWQPYAAGAAAAYARELLETLPPPVEILSRATPHGPARKPDAPGCPTSEARQKLLERRKVLMKSLDFPEIDARKATIENAHAKTCEWILQHPSYQDWLDPTKHSRSHGFLWMRGKAGVGKSTMMKFIYLNTKRREQEGAVVASFFFNARGDYLEKSVVGMYRSILMQLFQTFPDLQSFFDDPDLVPPGQKDCPHLNVLKQLLRSATMALGRRCFTCFVDALDECDEQQVREMVQFFEDLAEAATRDGVRLRICFASRPYPYIKIFCGALITLEDEPGHQKDLADYVRDRLRIEDTLVLQAVQEEILAKAAGIFMWVILVVNILNREDDHGSLALMRKLNEIPSKLSDIFKSIITRDQERVDQLRLCILWVLFAKEPLSAAEFRHALWAGLLDSGSVDSSLPGGTEADAVRLVTSSSKGLVELTKSSGPKLQFIHESVRDFLIKENGLQDLWPDLGSEWEACSHETLKRCCVTYLSFPGVRAVADSLKDNHDSDFRAGSAESCPFLAYASLFVLHHANAASVVFSQDEFLAQSFGSAGFPITRQYRYEYKAWLYGSKFTPLFVLADLGLEHLIRIQMKSEMPDYVRGERYEFPIFAALAKGHKGAVAALLNLPSTIYDGIDIMNERGQANQTGRTPLSWAAEAGRQALVGALIEAGAPINERDRRGSCPLIRAIRGRQEAVVRLLIAKKADLEARNSYGGTALMIALEDGNETITRLLIENGADVNARNHYGGTPLLTALSRNRMAEVWLLLEGGADVGTSYHRETLLTMASEYGNEAIVRRLIEKGVDLETPSCVETPLTIASRWGHEAVVQLLIERGANVRALDGNGDTVR